MSNVSSYGVLLTVPAPVIAERGVGGSFFFFLLLPIFIFPTSLASLPPRLLTLSTMHLLLLFLLCRQSVLLGMSFVHC